MIFKRLNLGCGEDYRSSWINLDSRKNIKTDIKCDLNKIPYPLKDNSFDLILAKNVLEHLDNPIKVIIELIRISKDKGKIVIIVPHATFYGNFSDLQHKGKFTETTFSKEHLREYELEQLEPINTRFLYSSNKWKKYIPFKNILKIFLNGIYDEILFEFKVKKT
jgi:predicted SAM-dependent methyltransferase